MLYIIQHFESLLHKLPTDITCYRFKLNHFEIFKRIVSVPNIFLVVYYKIHFNEQPNYKIVRGT